MGITYVYQYWHGQRPEYIQRLEATVKRIYDNKPGYQYFQITDEILPDCIKKLFTINVRIEQISDIIRYYYLWKTGGVWLDSDIAFRRFIDFRKLIEERPERIVTTNVRYPYFIEASTGVMACNKGNLIARELYQIGESLLTGYSGKNVPYIFVGPALATSLLHYNPNWYCLPNNGYNHQYIEWSYYNQKLNIDNVQVEDTWYYAHFTGTNAKKWYDNHYNPDTIIEQTVRRCENEAS